jgi:hypothetical protein
MELFFGGFASLVIYLAVVPLGLIVLGIAIVVSGRREPDPTGSRATAIYLAAICFLALFTVLISVTGAVGSLSSLIVPDEAQEVDCGELESGGIPDFDTFDEFEDLQVCQEGDQASVDDAAVRSTVQAVLVGLPALAALIFHWRRRRQLTETPDFEETPGGRADRAYLYVVCFFAAVIAVGAISGVLYDLFRLVAPGVSSPDGDGEFVRHEAFANLLTLLVLTVGALAIFSAHWSRVSGEPGIREWLANRRSAGPPPSSGEPSPYAPPTVPPPTLPPPPTTPPPSAPPG